MAFNEAPSSVSYSIKTSGGFPCLFTMRAENEEDLLNRMAVQEQYFISNGFTPDIKSWGSKPKKEVEEVQGRACPKCGAKLVYFESKGLKHIKCSTQKWDFTTKKTTGCDFVEWADAPTGAVVTQSMSGGVMGATLAQKNLILDKWPELWKEGMSKAEASDVIKTNYSK